MARAVLTARRMDNEHKSRTYLPTYHACFVCGQSHSSGLGARFYVGENGTVHGLFRPNQSQTGYANIVHGGIITAFLDELMSWPICLANERICYTGELTVRFKGQVFAGRSYLGTAYPATRHEGKRYWDGRGALTDQDGTVLVEATGRYFVVAESLTRAFGAEMTYQPGDLPIFRAPLAAGRTVP